MKHSKGYVERTTMVPEGVTITPPSGTPRTVTEYVASNEEPDEADAERMGGELFDAIVKQQARYARQQNS